MITFVFIAKFKCNSIPIQTESKKERGIKHVDLKIHLYTSPKVSLNREIAQNVDPAIYFKTIEIDEVYWISNNKHNINISLLVICNDQIHNSSIYPTILDATIRNKIYLRIYLSISLS